MKDQKDKLFTEFPPVAVADWEKQILQDLKGADYEKKLIRKTLENFRIKPYYTAEDLSNSGYLHQLPGEFPFLRGDKAIGNSWEVRQDFVVDQIEITINKVDSAIERGATAIGLDFTAKGDLYYHDFKKLITGIPVSKVSLHLIAGDDSLTILQHLLKAMNELPIENTLLSGSLNYDPLGHLTRTGNFYRSEEQDLSDAGALLLTAVNELPNFRVLAANSSLFRDSGASAVQELAYGLAMIGEYMTRLTDQKHDAVDIARHLQWNMGTGSDYFMEIAKIRAARVLFSALIKTFDPEQTKKTSVYINTITTSWNKTIYDPEVNLLRLTTEAMAAILGGTDSLLVRPFDSCFREAKEFSERLARNLQNIIKEESYFDKVADPAAGSYYIESLTQSLIESAWNLFLKVDNKGGYFQALSVGFIPEEINKTAATRKEMVASRREALLGTNQYPNFHEKMAEEVDASIAFPGVDDTIRKVTMPVPASRASVEFEKLRIRTERKPGSPPVVFLLTIGNLSMRLARAQFSANFFSCAGYEIIENLGCNSSAEGVKAAFEAKADIIVVCSSDEEYAEFVPEVARLVNDKAIVVVAGTPACMDELKQKGIHEFIHMRSNVLENLQHFHTKLGIA